MPHLPFSRSRLLRIAFVHDQVLSLLSILSFTFFALLSDFRNLPDDISCRREMREFRNLVLARRLL
jgi:hypothetical protein